MVEFTLNGLWSWARRGPGSSDSDNFRREPRFLGTSGSGRPVTRETAFQTAAMFCGARVISQGIAQVPFKLFRRETKNERVLTPAVYDSPLHKFLAEQPNDFMTAFSFWETIVLHAIFAHGGFAYLNRRQDGSLRELLPIIPDDIRPEWNKEKRVLEYLWQAGTERRVLAPNDVLHVHGPSWNGYSGLEALALAREALGLSAAMEKGQSDQFSKGGRPSGVLSTERTGLGADQIDVLKERWQEQFGPDGKGGTAVLDGGWAFTPMQMSAVDQQYIETRRFQIEEIARFLVVFPQMLMQSDKTSTYASAEQFFLAHVTHSLDPWMDRIEQEIKRSVIGYEGDNKNLYPQFVRTGLLRTTATDRAEYLKAALGSGGHQPWMDVNSARQIDGLEPFDDVAFDRPVQPLTVTAPPAGEETQE